MHAARVQPQRQLPPRGELRAGARRLRRRAQRGRGRRQRAVAREEREARVRARPRRRCAAQAPRACAHTTLLRVLFGLWGPTGCTCGLAGSISRSACIQGWGKSARRAGTAHGNHCRSRARARAASEQPGAPGPTRARAHGARGFQRERGGRARTAAQPGRGLAHAGRQPARAQYLHAQHGANRARLRRWRRQALCAHAQDPPQLGLQGHGNKPLWLDGGLHECPKTHHIQALTWQPASSPHESRQLTDPPPHPAHPAARGSRLFGRQVRLLCKRKRRAAQAYLRQYRRGWRRRCRTRRSAAKRCHRQKPPALLDHPLRAPPRAHRPRPRQARPRCTLRRP